MQAAYGVRNMPQKTGILIALVILSTACPGVVVSAEVDEEESHEFLADTYRGPRVTPISLGRFPHQCVGNVRACPDGFTVSLWTTPQPRDPRTPHVYILSSGGQSSMSEGYYVRRTHGKEYEVGVSRGEEQWRVMVYLTNGKRSNLAFSWSAEEGLTVFVDGMEAGRVVAPRGRIYTSPAVDPFTEIVVGKANDDVRLGASYPDVEIGHIQHWDSVKTAQQILDFIDSDGSAFYEGCLEQFPGSGLTSNNAADAATPATCRKHCALQHKQFGLMVSGVSCDCADSVPSDLLLPQCASAANFRVYRATSLRTNVDYPINLHVAQVPTEKGYILPGETIVFETSQAADEVVTFHVDFRDGHTLTTTDAAFSHAFADAGVYSVNVTAKTRTTAETKFLEVKVEAIDEGKPPALLHLKTDSTAKSRSVMAYLTALGYQTETCSLDFGDGTTERYDDSDMIFNIMQEHTYETIGFYGVVAECENGYGSISEDETIMVVHPTFEYEYQVRNLDISIPILGADVESNNLLVLVNEKETQVTASGKDVVLNEAVFSYSGEHLIQLKGKGGRTMFTKVFNLQTPIDEVDISANIIHTEVNDNIELEFRIGKGDQMHVWISYGDGEEEFLYIPAPQEPGPVTIHRNKTFSELGLYNVEIVVANDVSSQKVSQAISIERPLEMAQLLSHNVTELGEPTVFSFDVDLHMSPSAPIQVEIDFNDGIVEAFTLGNHQPIPELLNVSHTFNTFGNYRVKALVFNNLSSIAVSTLVQVGENITYIDMFTNKERVQQDEEVEITIHCPRGNPIHLEVDFGDGTSKIIDRPEIIDQYLDGVIPDPTTTAVPTSTKTPIMEEEESSGEILTLEGAEVLAVNSTRKRRSVEDEEGSGEIEEIKEPATPKPPYVETTKLVTPPTPTLAPRLSFVVKHKYQTAGTYVVKASVKNKFGSADAFLCPAITVVSASATAITCSELKASILNKTTEQSPIVMMRSKEITFAGESTSECLDPEGRTLLVRHSWSAKKLSPYQEWRPELAVCQQELVGSAMSLPPNRLWYGLYKINYKVSIRTGPKRVRRNAEGELIDETEAMLLDAEERLAAESLAEDETDYTKIMQEKFEPIVVIDETEGTLLASTSDVTYLEVIPTPLVIQARGVKDGDRRDVTWWEWVSIDLDASYDPDIPVGQKNKSGMNFDIVCYQRKYEAQVKTMSLPELLYYSNKIANNTVNTARLWEYEYVFEIVDKYVRVFGYEAVFSGKHITMNDTVVCTSFVSKDERVSSLSTMYQSLDTNFTDVGAALDRIDDLLASGDTSAALMVIDMATDALSAVGGDNETDAKSARSAMRGKLIGALGSCADNVKNLDQLEKTAGALNKITEVADEVNDDGKETAANALGSAAGKAGSLAEDAPIGQVTGMVGDMMGTAGNVLPFEEEEEEPEYELDMEGNPILPEGVTLAYEDGSEADGGRSQRAAGTTSRPDLQPTSPPGTVPEDEEEEEDIPCCVREAGLCEWIEPSCQAIDDDDRKKDVWDEFICDEIHPDDMKIYRERFEQMKKAKKLTKYEQRKKTTAGGWGACNKMGDVVQGKQGDNKEEINIDTPKIKMKLAKVDPNSNSSLGAFKVPAGLGAEGGGAAILESPNPFTYSDSASEVKSKVISMTMKNPDGTPMEVSGTDDPIEMWIPGKPSLVPPARKFSFLTSPESDKVTLNYHSILVTTNNTGMHIIVRPQSPDDRYRLYLKYMDFPNETYYDWFGEVPTEQEFDTEDAWKLEQLRYTAFPPTNLTALNGTYKIGIQLLETKMTLENLGKENNFTYSFRAFTSGCRFWNESTDQWESGGCDVGPLTTIKETQCLCTHLTSFGGDFVVPPNTIDFNTVFSAEKFLESMPVFCTVIAILVIYIAALVWCRIQDKKDLIKWGATPLEDNLPTDTYHYQVTVNTGLKKHSGTQSRIQFILSGDESDTGVRRLFDGKRKELPAGSIYNYLLSVEHCLGPLTYLRIWHDNSGKGKSKSWFLDQIMITDIQTGEKFIFLCNRWLAVEEDDGMVERVLPVAGLADLTAFNHLFGASVRKKLTNDHLWFSVVSRPTKSSFTRVQRVSCCVSLLFLTMITNCMFFKADDNVENVSTLQVGPFAFTLHQLFISIVTTAIVFPPSMFIVTVFRKARPKNNGIMQMNQQLSQKSKKFRWRKMNGGSSLWNNVEQTKMQKFKDSMRNIMTFHQKSKYETEGGAGGDDVLTKKKKKKGWSLPWWTIYIAWIMSITCIVASAFFTILYSMEWGKEKSMDWLATFLMSFFQSVVVVQPLKFFAVVGPAFFTILYSMEWGREKSLEWLSTFILSFFQSVVVVQPIKVLLLAAFISCVLRKPDLEEEEESFDDVNASSSASSADLSASQRDLQEIIKARQIKATDIPPPDTEALEKARQTRMNEMQMEAILKECIVYFFFIMVLFFLSYQTRDADSFTFAENIKNTFVRTSPSFDSINAPEKFWSYTFNALLPNLYTDKWYNGKDINWQEALQIDDRNTIRVGVARFRQLRIKEDTCRIQPGFETLITHCRADYNWRDDDTKDYDPGWKIPDPEKNETAGVSHSQMYCTLIGEKNAALNGQKHSPWIYRDSVELKNGPYAGTIGMYKGGGYTFTFRRSRKKTERLLSILENLEWIDTKTRGVFLEFTLYNANVNLFGSVIMLVEWMAAGSAITRAEVKVFRLSSYVGGFGIIVVFFEVCYLCFTLYFMKRLYSMLKKERLKYFKDFWNVLEFTTLVMSIVAVAMYAMKKIFGNVAMNALAESGSGDYVNFVTISIWDEIFGFILALVVFTSTIKFIKMLKFNKRMSMLGDTVKVAMKDIKNFMVVFTVFFLAFALCGYLLFGKNLPSYGSFIGTLEALFAFALGDFDFDAFKDTHTFLGPIFFFMYVLVVYIGLMGMFLTIIYDAFAEVKANAEMQSNEYEIVDFMMKKFKGVFGWS